MQSNKIDMQALIDAIKRFKNDARAQHYLMTEHRFENKAAPMLCFKSTSNNMPRALKKHKEH